MNRKKNINRIAELISRFIAEVETLNSLSLYDVNIHAENVLIPIINYVYNYKLSNANHEEKNYSAVDLIDRVNRIAIQVTSTANSEKVKHTLNQYKKHKERDEFDTLLIFLITKKQKTYSDQKFREIIEGQFEFSSAENIIDLRDVITEINSWHSIPKIQKVLDLLNAEFSEEEIDKRRNILENTERINQEILYPNLLEIFLPETIYVGTLNVDREKIITESWNTEYKLKKSSSDFKVVNRAFNIEGIPFCRDWNLLDKKLISFRPLNSNLEPLNKLVESGTVEEFSVLEFAEISYKYELAVLRLIDRSIQELTFAKNIQWVANQRIFRFKPPKLIRTRKIKWKNKKTATRTVVKELWNKEKTVITHFQQLSFKIQSFLSENRWLISITPDWSYTYDGYRTHNYESDLKTNKKKLETNNAVYQHFMFISYCLRNKLSEDENDYKLITINKPYKLPFEFKSTYEN